MNHLPLSAQPPLPFLLASLVSFLFSVWPYFVHGGRPVGNFVGLWAPSIHPLGTLQLTPVEAPVVRERREVMS